MGNFIVLLFAFRISDVAPNVPLLITGFTFIDGSASAEDTLSLNMALFFMLQLSPLLVLPMTS